MPSTLEEMKLKPEEVAGAKAKMEAMHRNWVWLERHKRGLRSKYSEKYVAVDGGQVIVSSEDLESLFLLVREGGFDRDTVAYDLITEEEFILVL